MNTLINAQEVVSLAFNTVEAVDCSLIGESTILSAERKFIAPVLGRNFYEAVRRGRYHDFCVGHLWQPLALYVRLLMLPMLSVQTGATGVMQYEGVNFSVADTRQLSALKKALRSEANTLMQMAMEYVQSHRDTFSEYDPALSIQGRVSLSGDIII